MCLIVFVRIYVRIHIRTCVQFECPRISRYCGYSNNKPPIVDGLYHRFMVIRGVVYYCYTNITEVENDIKASTDPHTNLLSSMPR